MTNHVVEHDGRFYNTQNELYNLPADDEEFDRLRLQHQIITMMLGLLYRMSDPVEVVMSPNPETPPAAIDIGTGSGAWAMDFAAKFPHASVLGIDLAFPNPNWSATCLSSSETLAYRLPLHSQLPKNCSFALWDANSPLTKFRDSFNVCHIRAIDSGIRDYEDLLYRVPEILRPNGILLMATGDLRLYTEEKKPCPYDMEESEPGWCAFQAILKHVADRARRAGSSPTAKYKWEKWLAANPYLDFVRVEDAFVPVGPWQSDLDDQSRHAAQLNQSNAATILDSFRHLLLSDGIEETKLNRWMLVRTESSAILKRHSYHLEYIDRQTRDSRDETKAFREMETCHRCPKHS
ncbi:hypothetical protein FRC03_001518 [Tulasnella sp. 419]|nr:hypothetical protein FRC03_001518 [Tulasnella sp. 419]